MFLREFFVGMVLIGSLALTSCGGGAGGATGGSVGGGGNNSTPNNTPGASPVVDLVISPVKGPMSNARVNVYRFDASFPELFDENAVIETGFTDNNAKLTRSFQLPAGADLIIEIRGGGSTDLNTGVAPVVPRLYTVVSGESIVSNVPVYVTPLSTLGFYLLQDRVRDLGIISAVESELAWIDNELQRRLPYEFGDDINIFHTQVVAPNSNVVDTDIFDKITILRAINEAFSASVHDAAGSNSVVHSEIIEELANEIHSGRFDAGEIDPTANGLDITAFSENPLIKFVPNTNIPIYKVGQLISSEAQIIGIQTAYFERPLILDIAKFHENDLEALYLGDSEVEGNLPAPMVASPQINTNEIAGSDAAEVLLSVTTNGARIYYTLDGNNPTESSLIYAGTPFTVTESVTIKVRAFSLGYTSSHVVTSDILIVSNNSSQYLNAPIMTSDFSIASSSSISRQSLGAIFGVSGVGGDESNMQRLSVVDRDGELWLQQRFTRNDGDNSFGLGRSGSQFTVPLPNGSHDEIYVSYDIELQEGLVLTKNGKFGPGLRGGPEMTTGGNRADGYNGFSMRNAFHHRLFGAPERQFPLETATVYYYYVDQPNNTGDTLPNRVNGSPLLWEKGKRISVQIRVKLNTAETFQGEGNGLRDGVLQVWYDGVISIDRRDIRWRHDDAIHIDDFFYSAFYGGGDSSFATLKEETMWTTNYAISNKPLLYSPPS
ncbi:MAG: hypothetical protein COC09_04200 [Gammaproteobacteria bacterium]|nr:chitobiase/beta-hexosaminidase C-terminal domain-containing protein [Gammaproteobacteria bacterium]PCH63999.1 MAG: hypothetical protein COC09_04200 [Gammaproteobacteria bacterium]